MSYSVQGVGKPDALKRMLDLQTYTGQSKEEYEAVLPHLKGLLDGCDENSVVTLSASGHASFTNGKRTFASASVEMKQLGKLCE